jgi:hypothetical protein
VVFSDFPPKNGVSGKFLQEKICSPLNFRKIVTYEVSEKPHFLGEKRGDP